jgi:hypothetical protein
MTKHARIAKAAQTRTPAKEQPLPPRQTHNNPASVDAFDREHMGIAAKE